MVGNLDVEVEHQQRVGPPAESSSAGDAGRHRLSWTGSTPMCPAGTSPKAQLPNEHFTDHFGIGQ